jgi:hypothetical protein
MPKTLHAAELILVDDEAAGSRASRYLRAGGARFFEPAKGTLFEAQGVPAGPKMAAMPIWNG